MGRYDSHKHPFQYRMNQWSQKRTNTADEQKTKSIPCHVTKVDKDFITVAFETQNGVFTPPTVKIPQSMSQYGRDPTQVGDKGFASPSDYYLGGVTGDAGGNTNFYPRGNLTAMSFQPVSHKQNPDRDVDTLTHMGGPNGWSVGPFKKQQQDQQSQNGGQTGVGNIGATTSFRVQQERLRSQMVRAGTLATSGNGGSSSGSSGSGSGSGGSQDDDKTMFSFDKDKKSTVQSKDEEHSMVVDQKNDHAHLSVSSGGKAYVGGTGSKGKYSPIMTKDGPSTNSFARIG